METVCEHLGLLVVTRCWCGVQHAVPKSLYDMQNRQHDDGEAQQGIYCPLGHLWTFSGESALKRQLNAKERELESRTKALVAARAAHDQTCAELRDKERSLSATKGVLTRVKNRVGKGVCPCCNRSFQNLHRHMTTQHPDFTREEATP